MILGTIGLGIVLVRNIIDRVQEIGILQAIGYRKKEVFRIITMEHLALLFVGTLSGTIAAFIAILPSLLSQFVSASWQTALVIIALVLGNGYVWVILITKRVLHNELFNSLRNE